MLGINLLLQEAENKVSYPSIIYGPTCDTLDIIMENVLLPELEIDNWIYFEGNFRCYHQQALNFDFLVYTRILDY